MVLPAGVRQLGTFQGGKGDKGDTGTIAFVTVEAIPADETPSAEMVGTPARRGAHFRLPRALPGADTVPTMDAVAAWIRSDGPVKDELSAVAAQVAALQVGPLAASTVDKGEAAGSPVQVAALVQKLRAGLEPATIVGLGDSTLFAETGWFNQLTAWLGAQFPAYTVRRRQWSDANQRYEMPTTLQVGTEGTRVYRTTGAADRFFTVADSPETSPSRLLDFRARVTLPAGQALTLGGKYDTATNNRSWFAQLTAVGRMELFFSTDGTAATQLTRSATASLPAEAFGVPVWLRYVFNGDNGQGGNNAAFYWSTDGEEWTPVGTTVITPGVQLIFDGVAPTQFIARSGNGNALSAPVDWHAFKLSTTLELTSRPAVDFDVSLWSGFGSNLSAGGANVATFRGFSGEVIRVDGTGNGGALTGAPVLNILNGGANGRTLAYVSDPVRFPKLTPIPADMTIVNLSHNEVGLIAYRDPYKALGEAILAKAPDTALVAVVQNQRKAPATNIVEHALRSSQIAALAASQRWGLLNIADAFRRTGAPDALVLNDGIHPNQAGYDVATEAGKALFTAWL